MDDNHKHSLAWQKVCSVLERLPKEKRTNRSDLMKDLFCEHRKLDPKSDTAPRGEHMYSLIRLLLPQLDREQDGNNVLYHMKEIKIAKTFIAALGIKGTPGAQKLLNWRKPEGGEGYGEFGTVLYHQLVAPGRVNRVGKKITVSDVNAFLHDMSAKEEDTDQEALVKDLCTKASALELKWIAKVLLKDLKASATETLVLGALHPDARQLFETNARLRDIVAKCSDPRTRVGSEGIQLMNPFRPMLAEKTEDLKSITKYFKNKPFWLEPKLDGERLLLHKDGEVMKCFTRNSNDYTLLYEPVLNKIKPHIRANKCILDGEILGWDREEERFLEFGTNVSLAKRAGGQVPRAGGNFIPNAKEGEKDVKLKNAQLCIILFDVLLIDNNKLDKVVLSERRERLRSIIKVEDKVLEIIKHTVVDTLETVMTELQEVVLNNEEGILLKDPASLYTANLRQKSGWLKLKPEYVVGGTQEYDVVIIGGGFGTNKRAGQMWKWVCGIAKKPPAGQEYPSEFVSFCRVATGLKHAGFRQLDEYLKKERRDYESKFPGWIWKTASFPDKSRGDMSIEVKKDGVAVTFGARVCGRETLPPVTVSFSGKQGEEVDVLFDPRKSVVLTLTADFRLVQGNVWPLGWTLRFPRIAPAPRGVRLTEFGGSDKPWHDVVDTEEIARHIDRSNNNKVKDDASEAQASRHFAKMLAKGEYQTIFQARGKKSKKEGGGGGGGGGWGAVTATHALFDADVEKVEVTSDVLSGCTVYVLPCASNESSRKERYDTQKQAHKLGATQVANHDALTTHLVGFCKDSQTFLNLQHHDKDVVSHLWIAECYEMKGHVPLEPRHMLHTSAKRRDEFSACFDRYGDSYIRNLDVTSLSDILKMDSLWANMQDDSDGEISGEDLDRLEDELIEAYRGSEAYLKLNAAAPACLESQMPSQYVMESQVPSFTDLEEGKAHEMLAWSLFRDVCAACVDDEEGETSARMALAKAHVRASGGKVCSWQDACMTHVVCSEERLERLGPRELLDSLANSYHRDMSALHLVTDTWIARCVRHKQVLPTSDDHLFSEERQQTEVSKVSKATKTAAPTPTVADMLQTHYVSAPFPACRARGEADQDAGRARGEEEEDGLDWWAIKVRMRVEVDVEHKRREYVDVVEITDGMRCWRAAFASYAEFAREGRLTGEALLEAPWSETVCKVLKFPWGCVDEAAQHTPRPPVPNCSWAFTADPQHKRNIQKAKDARLLRAQTEAAASKPGEGSKKRSWGATVGGCSGSGGRELCVSWDTPSEHMTFQSHFVAWLEEDACAQHVVQDITSLLISQAQHMSSEIRREDSRLQEAERLMEAGQQSNKRLAESLKGNECQGDWKFMAKAGTELVNKEKRAMQEHLYKEEQMDRAADYHSSEEEDAKKHCSQCGKASTKVDRRACESCGSSAWTFERIADEEEEEAAAGGSNSTHTPSCPRLPAQSLVCVTAVPRNARKGQKK